MSKSSLALMPVVESGLGEKGRNIFLQSQKQNETLKLFGEDLYMCVTL